MSNNITLSEMLGIKHPIIVAPMFLISNTDMVVAACESGATAAFPALNYRTDKELRAAINNIKQRTSKPFGINLIVNKSNPKYREQLKTITELKVDYIITSLGSPQETINKCKPLGIKVFCDVVNVDYAQKVEAMGADALVAVNNRAGGHLGHLSQEELITNLKNNSNLPVISAGGISNFENVKEAMNLGACGVQVGTIFLASKEAALSKDYQDALIQYGEKDIVTTTKLSGTKCTVINTPYVQSIGTKENLLEKIINRNKKLKKYAKLLLAYKGMKLLEKAAFSATYKTVWCAGVAIESIKEIRPLAEILKDLVEE